MASSPGRIGWSWWKMGWIRLAYRPMADTGKLRAELGIAAEVPIIGSVGRLEEIKGYDVMVEAFAILRREWSHGPAPVLVVGGDGTERTRCAEMARTYGLEDSVFLLGWRDDIHDLHSAFTLFTMSSRSEGTSVSLLEAMSAGLCPVVTDVRRHRGPAAARDRTTRSRRGRCRGPGGSRGPRRATR